MRMPPTSQQRAFTLIELLVVIAIIAILAALLFPALATAKAKAVRVTCINNEKQMVLAMSMYATDNTDHLAFPNWDGGAALTTPAQAGWLYTVDRKSTRLNSSHANISYAVFC